jgi:hypothetical protein
MVIKLVKGKTKRKSKSISKQKRKSKVKEKPIYLKTLKEMSLAELRIIAKRYDVKSGGIKKETLIRRLKVKQKKLQEVNPNLQNLPSGESITTADFEEEDYHVSIIDHDVEPHGKVVIDDLGTGIYRIQQQTVLGETEDTLVTISDTPEGIKKKQKLAELRNSKPKRNSKYWIQKAHFKKGTMRAYVKNKYGASGFNKDGTLKMSILEEIKNDPTVQDKTRKRAIAAITLKRIAGGDNLAVEDTLKSKGSNWWQWMGIKRPKSDYITIYRGVSKEKGTWDNEIKSGDWVSLDKKQAKELYAQFPNSKVLSKRVKLEDLREASTNSPRSIELIYLPSK